MTIAVKPTDPLFPYQWGLHNTGQAHGGIGIDIAVLPVWADYTGAGVRVGVIDSGVQLDHPDLRDNIDPVATWSAALDQPGGDPLDAGENHGTAVAGIIAAAANGIGGVGVAPNATLGVYHVGFGLDLSYPVHPAQFEIAFRHALADRMDVVNNSWGSTVPFAGDIYDEVQQLAEEGRDGLGSVIIFANGNGRADGEDGGLELQHNLPYVITVGALQNNGVITGYSTPGADLLISAPGGAQTSQSQTRPGNGIATTDRMGAAGYNQTPGSAGDYAYGFNGTSAATPFVSGVVALMLEANQGLGYRDVQEILAKSARITDESATNWHSTASGDWNGGGSLFSRDYGFGLVDAHAAVRLAESYAGRTAKTAATALQVESEGAVPSPMALGSRSWTSLPIEVAAGITIEHVQLGIDVDTADAANLVIDLVSPQGSRIRLLEAAEFTRNESWPEGGFILGTPGFWGEQGGGTWHLSVLSLNEDPSATESLLAASVEITGSPAGSRHEVVYTDDFRALATETPSRLTLASPSSEIIVNAAAVTGQVLLDLPARTVSIDGMVTAIDSATRIATIYGGDGNDLFRGDASDTIFAPGRGVNVMEGGGGQDTLKLLHSLSAYTEQASGFRAILVSGQSRDTLSSIDTVRFDDGSIALGTDPLVRSVYYSQQNADVFAAGVAADAHYAAYGWHEGRDPNAWFSTTAYLANHADVRMADVNPLAFYDTVGWTLGHDPSARFDTSLYLHFNPDVAAAGINPLRHWLEHGQAEGRKIAPVVDSSALQDGFDPTYYWLANPDVAGAGADPLQHWLNFGWQENRDPSAFFDTSYYLAAYADVATAGVNPFEHYLAYGWKEGRDPSSQFDTEAYLAHYADVAAAGMDPLLHFLNYGLAEGRSALGEPV
ncbi:MAG TPA: S8 family serine peptidase [Roseomonas sp.]